MAQSKKPTQCGNNDGCDILTERRIKLEIPVLLLVVRKTRQQM
jgi:hypothetical protein